MRCGHGRTVPEVSLHSHRGSGPSVLIIQRFCSRLWLQTRHHCAATGYHTNVCFHGLEHRLNHMQRVILVPEQVPRENAPGETAVPFDASFPWASPDENVYNRLRSQFNWECATKARVSSCDWNSRPPRLRRNQA
jgi:hypothetical protein